MHSSVLLLTLCQLSRSHSSSGSCFYCPLWYTYTISTISLLLASTIMTSNGPAVASSVTPNLSPGAKHQITHITYVYTLFLSFLFLPLCLSFFISVFLSLDRSRSTRCMYSHTPLLRFLAVCQAGSAEISSALLLCFQLSLGYHSLSPSSTGCQ